MLNEKWKLIVMGLVIGLISVALFLVVTRSAGATYIPKTDICHFDGQSGNFQTLNIAVPASIAHLIQHNQDYSGACQEEEEVCEDDSATNYGEALPCEYLPDFCPEEGYQPYGPCEVVEEPTCEELQNCPKEEPVYPYIHVDSWSEPEKKGPPGVCSDKVPGDVANINVNVGTPNDSKLEVQWSLPEGADKVHIRYREYGEAYEHALLNTPNDGNEVIGELKNGVNYAFSVAGVNGCSVGTYSKEFDPKP